MALNFLNNGYFAGKVGIGTESPGAVLSVRNPTAGTSAFSLQHSTTSSIFDFQTGIANVTGDALVIKDVANSYDYITLRGGNVGIGTTVPDYKLDIRNGELTVRPSFSGNVGLVKIGHSSSNAILQLYDSSANENVRISTSLSSYFNGGNVGIGDTTPLSKLEVAGSIKSTNYDTSHASESGVTLGYNVMEAMAYLETWTSKPLTFRTYNYQAFNISGSEAMRIDASRNVGIGVTGPSSKLVVAKNINPAITILDTTTIPAGTQNAGNNITFGTLQFQWGAESYSYMPSIEARFNETDASFGRKAGLDFKVGNIGSVTAMSILSDGNVGIGTTSPSQKLHVAGNLRVEGAYYDSNNSPGTANQVLVSTVTGTDWIDGSAIPGVPGGSGTLNTIPLWTPDGDTLGNSIITQPTSAEVSVGGKLKVSSTVAGYSSTKIQTGGFGDSQSGINILNSTTGYGYILFGDGSGADLYRGQITYKHGDDFMAFNTAGSERIRIIDNGNVGIGTTSPGEKLSVNGNIESLDTFILNYTNNGIKWQQLFDGANSWNLRYYNGTAWSGSAITVKADGNVGIGETSPDFRLDVSKGYTSGNGKVAKFRSGNDATFVNFDTVQVVQQDVPCLAIIETPTGAQADEQKLTFAVGDNKAIIGTTSTVTNGMSFYTNRAVTTTGFTAQGNLALHLANTGNVGIGTTSPDAQLELYKASNTSTIRLSASATDTTYYSDISNNYNSGNTFQITTGGGNVIKASESAYNSITIGGFNNTITLYPNSGYTNITGNLTVVGNIITGAALLSNQENTDVDTGTETVASVAVATYTAAFFDFVIKKTTNVRSGTVYACHDGTNVEFTETSTQDLGDTSDVTLSVDISGTNMRLRATTTSDDWSVKSLIRAI